jgi:hypothetical protein
VRNRWEEGALTRHKLELRKPVKSDLQLCKVLGNFLQNERQEYYSLENLILFSLLFDVVSQQIIRKRRVNFRMVHGSKAGLQIMHEICPNVT